ncbi:MAG: hypothetical protein WEA58_10190 [Balneolaceae bacterium]
MELNFFDAEEIQGNAKCTVHKSGKLGFSMDAIDLMGIDEQRSISIAKGSDYEENGNLYMKVHNDNVKGAFSVSKAGKYYYLNTKNLFNQLNLNYQKDKIIYDVVETEIEGGKYFKLIRRIKGRT